MHFFGIICADIVFKFCMYAHKRINRERGAMTFKGGSKGAKHGHGPKRPKIAQNRLIPRYNKNTKQLVFIKI